MPVVQWMILVLGLSTITPDLGQYSAEFAVGNNGVDGLAGGGSCDYDGAPPSAIGGGMAHSGYNNPSNGYDQFGATLGGGPTMGIGGDSNNTGGDGGGGGSGYMGGLPQTTASAPSVHSRIPAGTVCFHIIGNLETMHD